MAILVLILIPVIFYHASQNYYGGYFENQRNERKACDANPLTLVTLLKGCVPPEKDKAVIWCFNA